MKNSGTHLETIGVLPAAGKGSRVAPLPCSKEVFPVGFHKMGEGLAGRPKVVCQYVLEQMCSAGVSKAFLVLRGGKWDVPAYLKDGISLGIKLAYLVLECSQGVPYTIDEAYPFLKCSRIVLGFPDTIVQPEGAFSQLLSQQAKNGSDVVLALFPAHDPKKVDMVELGGDGRVKAIEVKPFSTNLRYTWIIATWTPTFTEFMHEYLLELKKTACVGHKMQEEIFLSNVIQGAIDLGMKVDTVTFDYGQYFDIGTPEGMLRAVQWAVRDHAVGIE